MIKKFIDEDGNTYIFIESDNRIILWLNGNCEYTVNTIISMPENLQDARRSSSLNIWYPINDIIG